MSAQLYVFPTRQTRPPAQHDEIVDVRAAFAELAAARDVDIANPYLTMVDGIDRLIAEAGLGDAEYLIKSALRIRGVSI
jgi:hypothetical protein